ncbi:DUF5027 family lipoprotein [Amphibacillus cookii]|uniref:DUF5027 family lipoprotein n=1 Tax=Amphibacillus cookii TaxID=767787 RepID=UPI00195DF3C5|nr:hypothetical protein [Amphibacillus cookii]MBM7542279.1 hypothetical protein [Amphibacillus cookii]
MRINKITILFICMFTILLSGCSYKELEDSFRSKSNNEEGDDQYINSSNVPEKSSESEEGGLFFAGDTITFTDPDNQTIEYTLNNVYVVDNLKEMNLNIDDFGEKDVISNDGSIDETYQLVLVDVTIKNVDFEGYDLEKDSPVLYIESAIGFKEGIEDPDGPWLFEASYFSEHPPMDQNQGQDYYQFMLAFGDELNATIGWFLPSDQLGEEPLYYIIGQAGMPEDYQYFELNVD